MKTTLEYLEATEKREIEYRRYRGNHPTMFAQLRLHSHFSGSGLESFGGHRRWPHITVNISLPANIPHPYTMAMLQELEDVLKRYSYNAE
jgi:hypothetical protein